MNARQQQSAAPKPVAPTCEQNISWGWKSDIARRLGVTVGHVSNVHAGRYSSSHVAREIALRLGKAHGELWPGRYPQAEFLESLAEKAVRS